MLWGPHRVCAACKHSFFLNILLDIVAELPQPKVYCMLYHIPQNLPVVTFFPDQLSIHQSLAWIAPKWKVIHCFHKFLNWLHWKLPFWTSGTAKDGILDFISQCSSLGEYYSSLLVSSVPSMAHHSMLIHFIETTVIVANIKPLESLLLKHGLHLISAWINNHIPKTFLDFNGCTIEVFE